MSSIRQIAELIPAEYRKEILELNMIENAVANDTNQSMHYLVVIWKNYVEPNFEPDCNLCRGRVLKNFRGLKSELIELEKEHNLLKSLQ